MIQRGHVIEPLASHPEAVPVLKSWFEAEWPNWYGPSGPGDAHQDLAEYAQHGAIPFGLVVYVDGELCGIAALKCDPIMGYENLSPWVGATLVAPRFRRQGLATSLLAALEREARDLGYRTLYAGTSPANGLLQRTGWRRMGDTSHNEEVISVYAKAL